MRKMRLQKMTALVAIIVLFISGMGIVFSAVLDVEFTEKYIVKKEICEQSKIGVEIFKRQLMIISVSIAIISLIVLIMAKRIGNLINKRKKIFQNVFLLFLTLIFMMVLGEIVLHLFFSEVILKEYGGGPGHLKQSNEAISNTLGYRDVQHQLEKKEDVTRILILGDSFTYGVGVEEFENIYGRQLQKKLDSLEKNPEMKNKMKNKYEVIILASPGYSTIDELKVLHDLGMKFKPDVVILGYVINDAEGPNSRKGFEKLFFHHFIRPYGLGRWLYQHSYFYYLLESRLKNIIRSLNLEKQNHADYVRHLYDPENPFREVHSRALSLLIQLAQKDGSEVIILNFPQLLPGEDYPYDFATEYVREITSDNGAFFLDLLPVYEKYNTEEIRVSLFDGHINEKGHRITAEALFEFMQEKKIVQHDYPKPN